MPTPLLMNKFAVAIKPFRAKILIIGLLATIPLAKFAFLPLLEGVEPFEGNVPYMIASAILFMWCFGLLMVSYIGFNEMPGFLGRFLPTFRKIGMWYGSIFWFVWFVFLFVATLGAIYGLLIVNK